MPVGRGSGASITPMTPGSSRWPSTIRPQGSIMAEIPVGVARATRDLRYWSARRASAQLIAPTEDDGAVRFGGSVSIEREDGRAQTWRIVGEDEADPAAGSVSHVSPLARAVMGKRVGDEVTVAGQSAEIVAVG